MSGPLLLAVESSRATRPASPLVEDGRRIHGNVVASQVALHAPTGGIVPEVAARAHLRWIVPGARRGARDAPGPRWTTSTPSRSPTGPGLAGSLLVGINFAKTLAWAHGKPLVPVNHLEGHVYAGWLLDPGEAEKEAPPFPLVALVVSGGHTFLVEMRDHLDLPPARHDGRRRGGRGVRQGRAAAGPRLPGRPGDLEGGRQRRRPATACSRGPGCRDTYDLSASRGSRPPPAGSCARRAPTRGCRPTSARAARSPIRSWRSSRGASRTRSSTCWPPRRSGRPRRSGARGIVLGGGVAANAALRARIAGEAEARGIAMVIPRPGLCTDNGAMIGAAGARRLAAGVRAGLDLDARPSLPLAR